MDKIVQPGSKLIAWQRCFLCGTSGMRKLCMVPCHSALGCFKVIICGGNVSHKGGRGDWEQFLWEKGSSHYIILLFCKSYWLL